MIKNGTEVTLNLSPNIIRNDGTNFPHKLLLTKTQVLEIQKPFANGSTANIKFSKLSKINLSKMIPLGKTKFRRRPEDVSKRRPMDVPV